MGGMVETGVQVNKDLQERGDLTGSRDLLGLPQGDSRTLVGDTILAQT